MNIKDFKPFEIDFPGIFKLQKELKFLFEPESKEVFENFDIDSHEDQEIFKRYCWRITEELTEALEDFKNKEHYREELIDGFNFLIELYLLYGWEYPDIEISDFVVKKKPTRDFILDVIYSLGISANCLKNRQWRQSQYMVDLLIFEKRLKEVWRKYIELLYRSGLDFDDISKLWSLKYQVNKFRINSNY